jgi:hypothetical protein
MTSELDASLIEAYRRTRYRVTGVSPSFELSVDRVSPELLALCRSLGLASAAFLTAWNPRSRPASASRNERAQADLQRRLDRRGLPWFAACGEAADGCWREDSVLVLGLSQPEAERMGRDFRQNALLWAGPDALPRLVLLR